MYLNEGEDSQHRVRLPVELDDGFGETWFSQLFGSDLDLMFPVSITQKNPGLISSFN